MAGEILSTEGRRVPPENILISGGGTFPCDARKESFDNITRKKFVISSADIGNDYLVICTSRDGPVSLSYNNYYYYCILFLLQRYINTGGGGGLWLANFKKKHFEITVGRWPKRCTQWIDF